jgi:hypothetical protein
MFYTRRQPKDERIPLYLALGAIIGCVFLAACAIVGAVI